MWGLDTALGYIRLLRGFGQRMYGNTSGYVSLKPADDAGSTDYTLPSSPPTADGQALTSTTAGVMSWIEAIRRVRIATVVTNITTTLAALTDLSMTLLAGRKYTGFLVLPVNNALAADGLKLDLNGGTATMTSIEFGFVSAPGATIGVSTSTALATALTLTALGSTSDVFVTVAITMTVNAGGTFIPKQAKNADAAGAILTLRASGFLFLVDTP